MIKQCVIAVLGTACLFFAAAASAEITKNMAYCEGVDTASTKRQTLVLLDSTLVAETPPEGEVPYWRELLLQIADAGSSTSPVQFAPHEFVSIGVVKADGSGIDLFFMGCVPSLSQKEMDELRANATTIDWLLGRDWEKHHKDDVRAFLKSAVVASATMADHLAVAPADDESFAESGLVMSLRSFNGVDLELGLPRIVLISDLSGYEFPKGDVSAVIRAAQLDGTNAGVGLGYAETHIITRNPLPERNAFDYLHGFFLASEGDLKTLAVGRSALNDIPPPIISQVFQGSMTLKNAAGELQKLPIRMRLAWDRNLNIVNSWMDETQIKTRFTPFNGLLTCSDEETCGYVGDGLFAQVWTDKPGGQAECYSLMDRMPFGGYRTFEFSISGDTLSGKMSDEACYFVGNEDGVPIELQRVKNGRL